MSSGISFLAIALAIAVGAISPGPSFILVAKTSLNSGRKVGFESAIGMALAGMLFAALAVFGLAALLMAATPLLVALRVLGAAYLAYLGVQMISNARTPLNTGDAPSDVTKGIWLGFRTQISNPKTIVVYASVFAAFLPHSPEPWLFVTLPVAIGLIEGIWYATVVILFSTALASSAYAKKKAWIDRIAGSVMIALALKLSLG